VDQDWAEQGFKVWRFSAVMQEQTLLLVPLSIGFPVDATAMLMNSHELPPLIRKIDFHMFLQI